MIYYVPHTMVYAIKHEELSDIVSATDENLARTTYFGSSTDFRRTYFAGHRNTNILYTLIKRLLGFCTITPPPPPHTRIYNLQCQEPSDRNSFIVFGTRRVHLKRQFRSGQLFRIELERTPIDRPT